MKKVSILFDLDGTLIDSTEAILDSFAYAFEKFGYPMAPKEKILALIGHPLDFMFFHLGIKEPSKLVEAYKECYRVISKEKTILLPHAKEAVFLAHSFAKLAVVTTKTGKYSKELLEYFGLLNLFEVVIGREDVIHPKPHPEPLFKAMKKMDSLVEHTWMVGDTCLDMDGAKNASIKAVAVASGYGLPKELRRCSDVLRKDALLAVKLIKKRELNY